MSKIMVFHDKKFLASGEADNGTKGADVESYEQLMQTVQGGLRLVYKRDRTPFIEKSDILFFIVFPWMC
jgi:hypothetical protein